MIDTDKEWEELGRTDPYYAVLSCDKFRAQKLDRAAVGKTFRLRNMDPRMKHGSPKSKRIIQIVSAFKGRVLAPNTS
jgi:hypothetical protein